MAIASLVLGIVSVIFVFFGALSWIGIPLGIVGMVLGALARKKGENKGMATAGLVCSIVAVGACVIATIACAACIGGLAALGES